MRVGFPQAREGFIYRGALCRESGGPGVPRNPACHQIAGAWYNGVCDKAHGDSFQATATTRPAFAETSKQRAVSIHLPRQ